MTHHASPAEPNVTAVESEIAAPELPVPAVAASAGAERPSSPRVRRAYRVAFFLTMVLIIVTLIALPVALRSMVSTVFGSAEDIVYNLKNGEPMSGAAMREAQTDRTYLNIEFNAIEEGTNAAALVASGHRECAGDCPNLDLFLSSVSPDVGRYGMAPFAEVQIRDATTAFTEPLQLPVDGNPSLYPFDDYTIELAVSGQAINAAGTPTALTRETFSNKLVVTVQDQVAEFTMEPPVAMTLPDADAADQYLDGIAGQELIFQRPTYLRMLTVMLVALIGISGGLSLLTRSIDDLLIGIGGLILGVWGVRSVIMPQPMPTLSLVEIALSSVILLILLGLSLRTAIYFFRKSEIPKPAITID